MPFIDTHAHLDDDQFEYDLDAVMERAVQSGVTRIVNIGYRPQRWKTTLQLAERHEMVSFALGLHPHHAEEWSTARKRELTSLLKSSGAIALGEIGIDLYRDGPPLATQRRVFQAQIDLAVVAGLPVVIHQRAADAEVAEVLRATPEELVCVLHSFEGTSEMAALATARAYYLGVGGLLTRKGAVTVRGVLRRFALDRLILETDSPYLVPSGTRAKRNEPANIPVIAQALAEVRGLAFREIERVTTNNARDVFGLTARGTATR